MPLGIQLAIAFVIGGGLGLFIGWLLGSRRRAIAPADLRLENNFASANRSNVNPATIKLQEQLQALNKRNGELDAELKSLGERLATERQQLETIQEKFRKEFEAVSNKLILDNTIRFNQQSVGKPRQIAHAVQRDAR